MLWICRNLPEAPLVVYEEGEDGILQIVRGHELPKRWKRPHKFFSGTLTMYGLLASYIIDGNGYLMKRRNESGRVAELWYTPHFMLEPRWDPSGNTFIDYYDYVVNGQHYPVPVDDIYHLRYGIDPTNIRKGRSPLATLFKELGIDEEASRFTAAILHNLGVPGLVIAPDKALPGEFDDPKREALKQKFKDTFSGDNRGDPIVLNRPTTVTQFGFSPNELDLGKIRDIPEERVTAVLGIPAAVVGFQQQNSAVGATRSQERDQAYENCIIPTQKIIADELTVQVLPEYAKNNTELDTYECGFDLSRVRVLMEAQGKLAERQSTLARSGIAKRREARAAVGLPTGPEDDIYIPSPGVQEIKPDGTPVNPMLVTGQGGNGAKPPQLALGPGKEFFDELEKKQQQQNALIMEGFKALADAIIEGSRAQAQVKALPAPSLTGGFKVLKDESGRFEGIQRIPLEDNN